MCLFMVCNILWLYRLEINRFLCVYIYCGILVKYIVMKYIKKKYCVYRNFRGWILFFWFLLNFFCKIIEVRIFYYLFMNGLIVFLFISI